MLILECVLPANSERLLALFNFLKLGLLIIQIIVPVGIILLGSIDLGKAVIAGDEKGIKKAQSTLIRRLIAAVLTFLVVLIVSLVFNVIGQNQWKECWSNPPTAYK